MSERNKRVAVIGSGMAGLTAAAYLAREGHSVTVYEQFETAGGVTASIHQDGFSWDLGPLLLDGFGPGDMGTKILADLGFNGILGSEPSDRGIVFPDFSLWKPDVYAGENWRKDYLKVLFPDDRKGLDRYYRFYRSMYRLFTLSRRGEINDGKTAVFDRLRMAVNFLLVKRYESLSAAELMEEFFSSPRLRAVFTGILADLVIKPSEFPALGLPLLNIESAFDARITVHGEKPEPRTVYRFIRNGCDELVEVVLKSLQSAGGVVRTSADVTGISLKDGKAAGVVVDGKVEAADIVIATGAARETFYNLLPPDLLSDDYKKVIDSQTEMESVFMVHLGVNYKPVQKSALCYYYGKYDLEKAVQSLREGRYHEGQDGFLIYIPSMHSPGMAPAGCHAVTVYTVAPNFIEGRNWDECSTEMADLLVKEAERYVPGLREGTISRVIVSPQDFRARVKQKHHSFGGIAPVQNSTNPAHRTPVKDLWFIGSQSEGGGGVTAVMRGARDAVRQIKLENDF